MGISLYIWMIGSYFLGFGLYTVIEICLKANGANGALYACLLVEGASNQTWDELWNLIKHEKLSPSIYFGD